MYTSWHPVESIRICLNRKLEEYLHFSPLSLSPSTKMKKQLVLYLQKGSAFSRKGPPPEESFGEKKRDPNKLSNGNNHVRKEGGIKTKGKRKEKKTNRAKKHWLVGSAMIYSVVMAGHIIWLGDRRYIQSSVSYVSPICFPPVPFIHLMCITLSGTSQRYGKVQAFIFTFSEKPHRGRERERESI